MKVIVHYTATLSEADLAALKAYHNVERFTLANAQQTLMEVGSIGLRAQIAQGKMRSKVAHPVLAPKRGLLTRLKVWVRSVLPTARGAQDAG